MNKEWMMGITRLAPRSRWSGSGWIAAGALASLFGAFGCAIEGSGNIVTEEYEVGPRTELDVCCGFEVVVTQGKERSLRVTGDDNIIERLVVREARDRLEVRLPESITGFLPSRPLLVEVTFDELRAIHGSGGVEIALGEFDVDRLDIDLSGGGSVRVDALVAERFSLDLSGGGTADVRDLTARSFDFEGSGGSELQVRGSVSLLEAELSGGGFIDAFSCDADDVTLDLSGGARARVTAHETLDVEASGGSDVRYRGKPRVRRELSGGSSVEPD